MPLASSINNKKRIISPKALILYLNYDQVCCYVPHLSVCKSISKYDASADLIPIIQEFLPTFTDLDFIGVTQGPGPFTTLRSVLATANGLSFASHVPLVGVDTLQALLSETTAQTNVILIMYNAFCDDVYFLIHDKKK